MDDIIKMGWPQKTFLNYMWMSGRIGRVQLAGRLIWVLLTSIVALSIMDVFLSSRYYPVFARSLVLFLNWLILCALGKRTHDIGYSAWWSLLFYIPIINLIYLVILMLAPGNKDTNEYGLSPIMKHKWLIAAPLIIFLLITGISIIDYYSLRNVQPAKNITYTELLQAIENQQVRSALIVSDNTFRGTLKTNEIVITKIPAEHSDLIRTLQRQKVSIKYGEAPKPPWTRVFFLGY